VGGTATKVLAVVSATLLLVMACNTAIVGNYHVNSRLVSSGFLPRWLGMRHRRYGTPWLSIAISAVVPMVVVVGTRGQVAALGDLYAFCLLGTLMLSSLSIDVLEWREHGNPFGFLMGSFTTAALLLAWVVNVLHKPHVLLSGGALVATLVCLALLYRTGWLGRPSGTPLPASFEEAEEIAARAPESAKLLTLAEAVDLAPLERSPIMVALRGVNEALLEDAALLARGLGEQNVYVVYVDEVPGLFLGNDVAPSDEAQEVLSKAYEILETRHRLLALPIWRLSSDSASAIAEAAKELGVRTLMVGTTRRGAIWHLLRGNILKGLVKALPGETRLLISS
jgi:nucleotide-binding universal stress UspA family protein